MSTTQTITIGPDGSIHGLLHQGENGVDITRMGLGPASIHRATLIEWLEEFQLWAIRWTDHGRAEFDVPAHGDNEILPPYWSVPMFEALQIHTEDAARLCPELTSRYEFLFDSYDGAVAFEVRTIQALQQRGFA